MFETNAKQDIFDKHGTLLLAKDYKITKDMIARLNKLGISLEISDIVEKNKNSPFFVNSMTIINSFENKIEFKNHNLISSVNKILISIIFESKKEPWWIFINGLSNYLEWLYTHSINVSIISMLIAKQLTYSDKAIRNIGIGAILHDIGKLLIPKDIIQKTEELNNFEKTLVRQHCELGMHSLETYSLPQEYLDIVLQHHERLDGSGYPNGLKEDEISLNAQIVMVADVIDACTTYCPNRASVGIRDIIKQLRQDNAKYSQDIVSIFEEVIK